LSIFSFLIIRLPTQAIPIPISRVYQLLKFL